MSAARLLPSAAHGLTRAVPATLRRALVEDVLNRVLGASIAQHRLAFLEGRVIALQADDAGLRWVLTLFRERLLVLPEEAEAETTIRGPLTVFADLARGRIDPDTAFFQRELMVEGDTELGLAAKNTLDALEPEELPRPLRRLLQH